MPFDVLPVQNVRIPEIHWQNIPYAEYVKMALESSRWAGQMFMDSLDKVLNAADPMTRVARAAKMGELHAEAAWYKLHPDLPWPGKTGFGGWNAYQRYMANQPMATPQHSGNAPGTNMPKEGEGGGQPQPSEMLPPSRIPMAQAAEIQQRRGDVVQSLLYPPIDTTPVTPPYPGGTEYPSRPFEQEETQGAAIPIPADATQHIGGGQAMVAPDYLDTHPSAYYGEQEGATGEV
jgi:hypothetical protein